MPEHTIMNNGININHNNNICCIHDDDHDNFHHYSDLEETEIERRERAKKCNKHKCILHKIR